MLYEVRMGETGLEMVIPWQYVLMLAFQKDQSDYLNYILKVINQKTDVRWDKSEQSWYIPLNCSSQEMSMLMYSSGSRRN